MRKWSLKLQTLPKTIEDCIEATLSFGLQYLWIDRYCIDQSDVEAKTDQISRMDMIYANAEITIIDAAGSGPYFGLPGVNKTKRAPQPSLKIDGVTLVSTLPSPRWSLQQSTWVSRGWTYQEGLLSKRRLVFTPQQTYFECNGMHIAESALMPVDVVHLRQDDEDGDITAGAFNFNNPGSSPVHLKHFIAEFTSKKLIFSQDTLDAMKGIFARFGKLDPPVENLMGIPLMPGVAKPYLPTNCFLAGLCWRLKSPAVRRAGFPSWTWAGWVGELESKWPLSNPSKLGRRMRVSLEHYNGSLSSLPIEHSTPMPHYYQDLRLSGMNICYVHVEARTFTCRLIPRPLPTLETDMENLGKIYHVFDSDRMYRGVDSDRIYREIDSVRTYDETETESFPQNLTALVSGDPIDVKLHDTFILCIEESSSFAERVGTLSLPWLPILGIDQEHKDHAPLANRFVTFLQRQPMRTIRLG